MSGAGQEAISWADLIVLAAKVAHVQSWTAQKVKRASIAQDGSTIAEAFGAAFPLPLGRVDATSPDAPVQVPTQTASPAEVKVNLNIEQTVAIRRLVRNEQALFDALSQAAVHLPCEHHAQKRSRYTFASKASNRQAAYLCVTSCSLFSCMPGQHNSPVQLIGPSVYEQSPLSSTDTDSV